ncbi:unnamed protein product [Larinioides sclopetarius]|uniref:Uncharacterized protein n=1 Tax=Larinioides sclopetarius TaxID=280406 RepID=A0AAV1YXY8_9ARAC
MMDENLYFIHSLEYTHRHCSIMGAHILQKTLFLAAFVSGVIVMADDNEDFITSLLCVSSSGNQELCEQFFVCNNMMGKKYTDAYTECLGKSLPNGPGNCSETEQLYGSDPIIRAVNYCIMDKTNDGENNWTMDKEMDNFKNCMVNLGKTCEAQKGN